MGVSETRGTLFGGLLLLVSIIVFGGMSGVPLLGFSVGDLGVPCWGPSFEGILLVGGVFCRSLF